VFGRQIRLPRRIAVALLGLTLVITTTAQAETARDTCAENTTPPERLIAACTQVLQSGSLAAPDRADAYNHRGIAYARKGQGELAIADFSQALRISPNHAAAYYNRGLAHQDKGQDDLAIADYSQALRIEPNYAFAYNNRGNVYRAKGQNDLAISDFNQALRIHPQDALAYNNRGLAYHGKGKYDLAIADYDQALGIDPNYAFAYNNRGNALHRSGQDDLAIADYGQALRIDPNFGHANYNRGQLFFALGRFPDSAADFERARSLDPADPYLALWRHIARARSGEDDSIAFATTAASFHGTKWPAPILELYVGKTTAAQALGSAETSEERCEVQFYVAEWELWHKYLDAALSGFRNAAESCPQTFAEYLGAKAELARLTR
jgi:lipoprotein NlpI